MTYEDLVDALKRRQRRDVAESYDDRQIRKPLRTCLRCQQPFYMDGDCCANCLQP